MRVIVTGANGFIGKNLSVNIKQSSNIKIVPFTRDNSINDLPELLKSVDCIVHLAGINRSENPDDFFDGNVLFTEQLCSAIQAGGLKIPIIYTSSIQAELNNTYGNTKRKSEDLLLKLQKINGNPVFIYRLPNVFGKWARPNYNSAIATFSYNIARDKPIQIHNPNAVIRMVYVDDVITNFKTLIENLLLSNSSAKTTFINIKPEYEITVGELVNQLQSFKESRNNLITEPVGAGLIRALYATYISYLPFESFAYPLKENVDARGKFVEIIKTINAGQFSFFTAYPGITRGGHYHHTKSEKFLVIKGKACFRFRNIITNETYELHSSENKSEIIEMVPGWTHNITNIGDDILICLLWANEVFDNDNPDTIPCSID